eukprot:3313510-Prymnesium_polylepis.1
MRHQACSVLGASQVDAYAHLDPQDQGDQGAQASSRSHALRPVAPRHLPRCFWRVVRVCHRLRRPLQRGADDAAVVRSSLIWHAP